MKSTALPPPLLLLLLTAAVALASCAPPQQQPQQQGKIDVSLLQPAEVVRLYYESFDKKDYAAMYALISDGFKEIEPTAKTYGLFAAEMGKYFKSGRGMKVLEMKEPEVDGDTAVVGYRVVLQLNTGERELDSVFTLRKRHNGWKLIHPYGQNIDTG
ncbi:nuclear transport factor 2 family protein [Candidatus Woesearchaeota archaeon]|nr:nuclear transport factor 2 family protein [Candidatus Woesearchaeota archaeon]